MTVVGPRVLVVGGGSWGTTVASVVSRNTETTLWARDPTVCDEVTREHTNNRYLPGIELHPALAAEPELATAARAADVVVMAVPSQGVRAACTALAASLPREVPVVSLVKGLEPGTRMRMTQVIAAELPGHPAGVLSGPNIAREVAAGFAAAATLAMPDQQLADSLQDLFHSSLFRIYTSTDVIGVEIAGALKNVFATAVGFGDGLQAGVNTSSMVITRSLRELARLGEAMGGDRHTFYGLAGLGDLIATCTSPLSRNRTVGFRLAGGESIEQILAGMTQVAEGVKSAAVVMELAAQYDVPMPIAAEVDAVLNHSQPVAQAYRGLLRAAPGHELHGPSW